MNDEAKPKRSGRTTPRKFTGSCAIREHTADDVYVGLCVHGTYDGVCPRHGLVEDYPTRDDREVLAVNRRMRP